MCLAIKTKLQGSLKGKKTQSKEKEQVSEPDIAGMLGLSDQEFNTPMTDMLRALWIK